MNGKDHLPKKEVDGMILLLKDVNGLGSDKRRARSDSEVSTQSRKMKEKCWFL